MQIYHIFTPKGLNRKKRTARPSDFDSEICVCVSPADNGEVGDNYAAIYSPSLSALAANFRRPSPFIPLRRGRRHRFCRPAPEVAANYRCASLRRGDGEVGPGGMGGEEGSSGEGSEVLTAREWRDGRGGWVRRDTNGVLSVSLSVSLIILGGGEGFTAVLTAR